VSDHGFAGGYQAVKRFVRTLRGPKRPEAAGIILTAAGEEAQVDYGSGPMVREPQSGKYRRTRLFSGSSATGTSPAYPNSPIFLRPRKSLSAPGAFLACGTLCSTSGSA